MIDFTQVMFETGSQLQWEFNNYSRADYERDYRMGFEKMLARIRFKIIDGLNEKVIITLSQDSLKQIDKMVHEDPSEEDDYWMRSPEYQPKKSNEKN